jgi:hypothetical protein
VANRTVIKTIKNERDIINSLKRCWGFRLNLLPTIRTGFNIGIIALRVAAMIPITCRILLSGSWCRLLNINRRCNRYCNHWWIRIIGVSIVIGVSTVVAQPIS